MLVMDIVNEQCSTRDGCECLPPEHQHQIKQLVKDYCCGGSWSKLRRGLEAVLDHESAAYQQLQGMELESSRPQWVIGRDGLVDLAKLLLSAGLPADKADIVGDTMLHGAAHGGHLPLVKMLVEQGANMVARDDTGWTPFMVAVVADRLQVVEWLHTAGAHIETQDNDGYTARNLAALYASKAMIVYLS